MSFGDVYYYECTKHPAHMFMSRKMRTECIHTLNGKKCGAPLTKGSKEKFEAARGELRDS